MLMESCGSLEALGTLLEALGRLKKAKRRSLRSYRSQLGHQNGHLEPLSIVWRYALKSRGILMVRY